MNPFIILIRVKRFSDKLGAFINSASLICCKNQADVENIGGVSATEETERQKYSSQWI